MHGRIFAYTTVDIIANPQAADDLCLATPDAIYEDIPYAVYYVDDNNLVADLPALQEIIGIQPETTTAALLNPEEPSVVAVLRGKHIQEIRNHLRRRAVERANAVRKMLTLDANDPHLIPRMHRASELLWPKYRIYFCSCNPQDYFVGNELEFLHHLEIANPEVVIFIWSYDYHF